MKISLPPDWDRCPGWWKYLVDKIEREAAPRGIDPAHYMWTRTLKESLAKEGITYYPDIGIVTFADEESYLIIILKYGT